MLRHQFGQDFVLGLHLLLQLNPFLLFLHLAVRTLLSLKGSSSVLEELLFASGRTPSASGAVLHTDPKLAPSPKGAASE
jgi:hypothetical protein